MMALTEMVFIGEIVLQSKIAQLAAKRLPGPHDHFDQIEVWCSIQSILVAAGNVSKILWPQKKCAKRGAILRKMLCIDENNILSDRKFRNHFEHYDERIEEWFAENTSAVYKDLAIDSFKSMWGNFPVKQHRTYNPLTHTLTFRGDSIDLTAVLNELDEIRLKCRPFALSQALPPQGIDENILQS
jgi:hypothetical protein